MWCESNPLIRWDDAIFSSPFPSMYIQTRMCLYAVYTLIHLNHVDVAEEDAVHELTMTLFRADNINLQVAQLDKLESSIHF